jgi:hypothetical protein
MLPAEPVRRSGLRSDPERDVPFLPGAGGRVPTGGLNAPDASRCPLFANYVAHSPSIRHFVGAFAINLGSLQLHFRREPYWRTGCSGRGRRGG